MFFVFLMSVSVLTVVITASCGRVLGECYLEGVREEEFGGSGISGVTQHYQESSLSGKVRQFHYHVLWQVLSKLPFELAFGLFGLLCAWSITSLTCFHALIITLGQTTNERVRGVYQYGGVINPADKGCWRNWRNMIWSRAPESRIPKDFSDVVDLSYGDCCVVATTNTTTKKKKPIVLEEGVWSGWQESQMVSPTKGKSNK